MTTTPDKTLEAKMTPSENQRALEALEQAFLEVCYNAERETFWYTDGRSGKERHLQRWATIGNDCLKTIRKVLSRDVGWRDIKDAPRDGTPILVNCKTHGAISAVFLKGEWSEHHEYGRQYEGAIWVLGDDLAQVEVEEYPDGKYHDGSLTHWQPLPPPPTDKTTDRGDG